MPAVLGPPPPRSRFHPDVYPEAEALLVCNISPEFTMLEDGSTRPEITLSASNCEHKAREGHPILESEVVRETFHVTLALALEDLATGGSWEPSARSQSTGSRWAPSPSGYPSHTTTSSSECATALS